VCHHPARLNTPNFGDAQEKTDVNSMENVSVRSTAVTSEGTANYAGPLAILTTLFFMWGSLTSLNDVLIPYAQHVFKIELAASMLIQTAFFSAYFVFSIPAAKIIDWIGYKKAIVVGLLTMVVACLGFFPAAKIPSFPFFLAALILLATGITILQVAANPYASIQFAGYHDLSLDRGPFDSPDNCCGDEPECLSRSRRRDPALCLFLCGGANTACHRHCAFQASANAIRRAPYRRED
jgi:hypothetical protein